MKVYIYNARQRSAIIICEPYQLQELKRSTSEQLCKIPDSAEPLILDLPCVLRVESGQEFTLTQIQPERNEEC